MKKLLIILTGVFILLLGSCQEKSTVFDDMPLYDPEEILLLCNDNFMAYQGSDTEVDFRGPLFGPTVTRPFITPHSSGIMFVTPNPGDCGQFSPPLQYRIEGSGEASLIGSYNILHKVCVDMQGNFLSPMEVSMTGNNGDQIFFQMGMPYPDLEEPPKIYIPYTISGGSGLFEGASGHITMHGIVDYASGTFSLEGIGEITIKLKYSYF